MAGKALPRVLEAALRGAEELEAEAAGAALSPWEAQAKQEHSREDFLAGADAVSSAAPQVAEAEAPADRAGASASVAVRAVNSRATATAWAAARSTRATPARATAIAAASTARRI